MRHRRTRTLAILALLAVSVVACGKKGNPLPPLRPLPSRIPDLTAHRTDDRIELRFTVPSTNADGSTPLALARIEIYRVVAPPLPVPVVPPAAVAVPPPSSSNSAPSQAPAAPLDPAAGGAPAATTPAAPLGGAAAPPSQAAPATQAPAPRPAPALPPVPVSLTSKNLRATLEVVQADADATTATPSPAATASQPRVLAGAVQRVAPGERAIFVDRIDTNAGAVRWSYVVVGVAGRNRRSAPSGTVTVPLTGGPSAPDRLVAANTETALTLSWQPAATGQSFLVFDVSSDSTPPKALTPTPLNAPQFTQPVEFGQERCFAVRALATTAGATIDSPLSAKECFTAVDRYPPAAPANLQAIQEGTVVTLSWTAVDAPDLAGYIVLRGGADGERLEPLMRTPFTGAIFRDTTVQAGATYVYTVYAVDNAAVPNVSQQSNRQTITVR